MKSSKKHDTSSTCDECGKSFKNPAGLRMHMARRHQGMGPQVGGGILKRASRNGGAPEEPKRRYTRKQQVVEVAYCPCCGLNLRALGAAISVAMKH